MSEKKEDEKVQLKLKQKNIYKTFKITEDNRKYNSLLDEFRRNKTLIKNKNFKVFEKQKLWIIFLINFKKTFRINKELKEDLIFTSTNMNRKIQYTIEKMDHDLYYLLVNWNENRDQYWLEFSVVDTWFQKSKKKMKIRQILYKDKTIQGLQDAMNSIFYERSFKKNIKFFYKSMKEINENYEKYKEEISLSNYEIFGENI